MLDTHLHIRYRIFRSEISDLRFDSRKPKRTNSLFSFRNGLDVESESSQVYLFGPVCQSTFSPFFAFDRAIRVLSQQKGIVL